MFVKKFWDNLKRSTPLYGSDVKGTLFEKNTKYPWNLNYLERTLRYSKK